MITFEQGFVATRYLLGTRGESVVEGLPLGRPAAATGASSRTPFDVENATGELATQLQNPDRNARSQALAGVLTALVIELEGRRIG